MPYWISHHAQRPELADLGERTSRGATAGLVSGLVFLIATMGYVTTQGLPAVAPMIDISTIFHGQDEPVPSPDNVVVGLVTHLTLAAFFGIIFALLASVLPRRVGVLLAAGVVYGLLLYVVNFQILGRTLFPWFTNPDGPDQGFEVFIHAVFGLLLVPFLIGVGAARAVADPGSRTGRPAARERVTAP
ncbi:MAG: hypothetical protein H0U00_14875 [Actinobacteria bacterium]|nr:hypothetical protein [Actinomycetota bacterium]